MMTNVYGSSFEVPKLFSDFNETWIVIDKFSNNIQISNFTKIRPMATELFRADGRRDRHDEANSRFSQFCERA